MSDRSFDSPSPEKLPLDKNGVPRAEVDGVDFDAVDSFEVEVNEVHVMIGDSILKLYSDNAIIVHHEKPEYRHLDHIIAKGLVLESDAEDFEEKVFKIFAPSDEIDLDFDSDEINAYDMLVFELQEEGFPIQLYPCGPSAETIERYRKSVRGGEDIDSLLARIIRTAGDEGDE